MLQQENKRLKAAIQNSGDVVRSPAEEGPAVAKQSAPTVSDVDMDMLHLGRKYDELEKEHDQLRAAHGELKGNYMFLCGEKTTEQELRYDVVASFHAVANALHGC